MGIRFFCPNGHKLNVKSELAGKVGICPKCGEKMLIPLISTRQTGENRESLRETMSEANNEYNTRDIAPNGSHLHLDHEVFVAPFVRPEEPYEDACEVLPEQHASHVPSISQSDQVPLPLPTSSSILLEDPHALWYVRALDNQTYGPANGTLFQNWMIEKRVAPTMLILREGWSAWREAKTVFPELEIDEAAIGGVVSDNFSPISANSGQSSLSIQKELGRKKKVGRDLTIVIVLIVLITFLITALVAILVMQQRGSRSQAATPALQSSSSTPTFSEYDILYNVNKVT